MSRTKIFFDCKFTGLHQDSTLVSIGFKVENGVKFYAELNDYDKNQVDDWLQKNVIHNLMFNGQNSNGIENYTKYQKGGEANPNALYSLVLECNKQKLEEELSLWLYQFESIELWSNPRCYNWEAFSKIFGRLLYKQRNLYSKYFDISDLFHEKGINPNINREQFAPFESSLTVEKARKHFSLYDAESIEACYHKLQTI
jgi:hypothetical protein